MAYSLPSRTMSFATWLCRLLALQAVYLHAVSCRTMQVNEAELDHPLYHRNSSRKRWVMAKNIELQEAQDSLSACKEEQPTLSEPYASGLPQSCLTYHQRYKQHRHRTNGLSRLNEALPNSSHTVLIRVAASTYWSKDLIQSIRALAYEVHDAGWHVWLYHQDSLASRSEERHHPAEFLMRVPEEFRPLLQTFDAQQLHAEFPDAHRYRDRRHWGETDFRWREYLGTSMFLDRFRAYEFAWIVEHDVRYTGKDWGILLNKLMHISSQALGYQLIGGREEDLLSLPAEEAFQPDFIVFSPVLLAPQVSSAESLMDNSSWVYPTDVKYFVNMYGISRRMNDFLIGQSKLGNGGFAEQFIPSTALNCDVKAVTISLGVWLSEHPMHCCADQIVDIYDSWFAIGRTLTAMLMHPIKNTNASIWVASKGIS